MSEKNFSGVEDTLFIPLAARVTVSERFPDYFYDAKALELKDLEPVRRIREKSSEYSVMASAARYYNTDRWIRAFAEGRGRVQIVNLGAGLETVNARLSLPDAVFFSLDFPKVIEIRKEILGVMPGERLISRDLKDLSLYEAMDEKLPTLFLLSGVFQYFEKEEVLAFIRALRARFREAEMVFDATNEEGLRFANRYVKKTGNASALMHFYINDPEVFAKEAGVTLMECRGFFEEARALLGRRLKWVTRLFMKVADAKKRTLLLRLKF